MFHCFVFIISIIHGNTCKTEKFDWHYLEYSSLLFGRELSVPALFNALAARKQLILTPNNYKFEHLNGFGPSSRTVDHVHVIAVGLSFHTVASP